MCELFMFIILNINLLLMSVNLLSRLEYLDYLITKSCTGSPKELSKKLKMSERSLYDLILTMKAMDAPIYYDRQKKSYRYRENGMFYFRFKKLPASQQANLIQAFG